MLFSEETPRVCPLKLFLMWVLQSALLPDMNLNFLVTQRLISDMQRVHH